MRPFFVGLHYQLPHPLPGRLHQHTHGSCFPALKLWSAPSSFTSFAFLSEAHTLSIRSHWASVSLVPCRNSLALSLPLMIQPVQWMACRRGVMEIHKKMILSPGHRHAWPGIASSSVARTICRKQTTAGQETVMRLMDGSFNVDGPLPVYRVCLFCFSANGKLKRSVPIPAADKASDSVTIKNMVHARTGAMRQR